MTPVKTLMFCFFNVSVKFVEKQKLEILFLQETLLVSE